MYKLKQMSSVWLINIIWSPKATLTQICDFFCKYLNKDSKKRGSTAFLSNFCFNPGSHVLHFQRSICILQYSRMISENFYFYLSIKWSSIKKINKTVDIILTFPLNREGCMVHNVTLKALSTKVRDNFLFWSRLV